MSECPTFAFFIDPKPDTFDGRLPTRNGPDGNPILRRNNGDASRSGKWMAANIFIVIIITDVKAKGKNKRFVRF
jgi:hypothetical protein